MRGLVLVVMFCCCMATSDIRFQKSDIGYSFFVESEDAWGQTLDAWGQTLDAWGQTPDAGGQTPDAGGQTPDAGGQTPNVPSTGQPERRAIPTFDTSDARAFQQAIRSLTTPALEERKRNRREMQQRLYAEVLYGLVQMDAVGSLLASMRSQAQLEFQLPQTPLSITIPIKQPQAVPPKLPGFTGAPSPPYVVTLFEDKRFPVDPWGLP
jgi:hypothetical protein